MFLERLLTKTAIAACSLFLSAGGIPAQEAPRQPTESKSDLFDPESGKGQKCYVVTRDDIHYGERPGVDPATGRPCRPVTPEVVERLRAYKWGNRPKRIETADPTFFSLRTGEAVVWYIKKESGVIELFDLMGFDPETGEELLPVTREIVTLWRRQESAKKEKELMSKQEEARKAPELIDPHMYALFDPKSGAPRAWYSLNGEGEYQFYDAPGYDPRTGEPLNIITRDIVDAWRNALQKRASQKCYIITRDAAKPVQYRERAGIDSETGRQCRPVTAEVMERLKEYEKGKRPTRIASGEPIFFDPRTGEPIIWHVRDQRGDIELFDLMGFHPSSGEELVPVTREIAALWKEQSTRLPPKLIDPRKHEWFDPLTGEPRVWYWRNGKGEYEFYDNPGYHPHTGEPLTRLNKETAEQLRKEAEAREKRRREESRRREEVERKRAEEIERARKKRADQEEKERRCDELAANPMDQNRKAGEKGVTFETLKEQAREAVEACELAWKQFPNELRFLYQWARALQTVDRQMALKLLKILIKKGYPGAFDNVGWLLITERKDYVEAVNHFRMGVQLGDPDAMASLAEMITKGYAVPTRERETPLELLKRAAKLGHVGAARALEQEQQGAPGLEQQRNFQEERYRRMHDFFRGIVPVVPPRFSN